MKIEAVLLVIKYFKHTLAEDNSTTLTKMCTQILQQV